jgi:hypothetical protein
MEICRAAARLRAPRCFRTRDSCNQGHSCTVCTLCMVQYTRPFVGEPPRIIDATLSKAQAVTGHHATDQRERLIIVGERSIGTSSYWTRLCFEGLVLAEHQSLTGSRTRARCSGCINYCETAKLRLCIPVAWCMM